MRYSVELFDPHAGNIIQMSELKIVQQVLTVLYSTTKLRIVHNASHNNQLFHDQASGSLQQAANCRKTKRCKIQNEIVNEEESEK